MPYFIYYEEKIMPNSDDKNASYCVTNFPQEFPFEICITIYTVIISYVLPLLTIIFCYVGMMKKFLKKSTEQNILEHSIKFSSFKKHKIVHKLNNHTSTTDDVTSDIMGNTHMSLLSINRYKNDLTQIKKTSNAVSLDNLNQVFSKLSTKRKRANTLNLASTSNTTINNGSSTNTNSNNNYNEDDCLKKARQKKNKILILIGTVSITFGLTWFPVHFIQLWRTVFQKHFPYTDLMYIIKVIAHTLSYSNSFINPFIYIFVGSKFKSHIKEEIFKCFKARKKEHRRSTLQFPTNMSRSNNYLAEKHIFNTHHRPSMFRPSNLSKNVSVVENENLNSNEE